MEKYLIVTDTTSAMDQEIARKNGIELISLSVKAARKAEKEMCKSRYLAFGCEGQGAKIHPIPLDAFARGYSDGTITQKTL